MGKKVSVPQVVGAILILHLQKPLGRGFSVTSAYGTKRTFVGTADRSALHCKAEVEVPAPLGGGGATISEEQPHAIADTSVTEMRSQDSTWDRVPITCDAERQMPDARG
jgi:hypothetical protein